MKDTSKQKDNIATSQPISPETESWQSHIWEQRQKTLDRIEDAAKTLSGMVSVSLAIFLSVGKAQFEQENGLGTSISFALVLWIFSLVVSFLVSFPFPYRYNDASVASYRKAHQEIRRVKYGLLIFAMVLFLGALGILIWRLL